jgi:hypothetical protein
MTGKWLEGNFINTISKEKFNLRSKSYQNNAAYEQRHDKTNIVGLQQAWMKTSLRIRTV